MSPGSRLLAAVLFLGLLGGGCAPGWRPFYPGVERLKEEGVPVTGEGVPAGSSAPAAAPAPGRPPAEIPALMEKYGGRTP